MERASKWRTIPLAARSLPPSANRAPRARIAPAGTPAVLGLRRRQEFLFRENLGPALSDSRSFSQTAARPPAAPPKLQFAKPPAHVETKTVRAPPSFLGSRSSAQLQAPRAKTETPGPA